MLKRMISKWFKRDAKYNNPERDVHFQYVLEELKQSEYCNISSDEELFIKTLLLKLRSSDETGILRLRRMSNKAIDASYNTYPIGKIKLQGRKTWMQILINLDDSKTLEQRNLDEYIQNIDLWIRYIKKVDRI